MVRPKNALVSPKFQDFLSAYNLKSVNCANFILLFWKLFVLIFLITYPIVFEGTKWQTGFIRIYISCEEWTDVSNNRKCLWLSALALPIPNKYLNACALRTKCHFAQLFSKINFRNMKISTLWISRINRKIRSTVWVLYVSSRHDEW